MAYKISSEVNVSDTDTSPSQLQLTDGTDTVTVQSSSALASTYTLRLPPVLGSTGTAFAMLNSIDSQWKYIGPNGGGALWLITDESPSGTAGGVIPLTTWTTRNLTTLTQSPLANTDIQLAVAPAGANQLLIQPGTYMVLGYTSGYRVTQYKSALWDDDTTTILLLGTSEMTTSVAYTSSTSFVFGVITLAVQTVVSYQIYVTTSGDPSNGGVATGIPAVPELYTRLSFYKL
jgi:hypothetical protein